MGMYFELKQTQLLSLTTFVLPARFVHLHCVLLQPNSQFSCSHLHMLSASTAEQTENLRFDSGTYSAVKNYYFTFYVSQ